MDERVDNTGSGAGTPSVRDYADVGDRVSAILNAAEEAAKQIRVEAERAAENARREAERESHRYADERRRQADEEVERRTAGAISDAEAIRDTAHAAAQRVADEGHRRLEELRVEARTLEGRFESTVDDLRDLITQLEDVVLNAVHHPAADEGRVDEPAEAEGPSHRVEEADLSDALWPPVERDERDAVEEPEREEPVRSHDGERPLS